MNTEQIMKLADAYAQSKAGHATVIACGHGGKEILERVTNAARAALESAIEALQAKLTAMEKQEPVGRFVCDGDCGHIDLVPYQGRPLVDGQSVYAAPKAQEPAPKPLTDEQIIEAIRNAPKMKPIYAGWVLDQRIAWARAIEKAHGIGGQQ